MTIDKRIKDMQISKMKIFSIQTKSFGIVYTLEKAIKAVSKTGLHELKFRSLKDGQLQ
jgi:hypothetical protein